MSWSNILDRDYVMKWRSMVAKNHEKEKKGVKLPENDFSA
jgi:hypothetical protein